MKILKADVEASGRPRYMKWSDVPEGLKTITQWKQEGMRLRAEAEPTGYVWSPGHNTHHALYASGSVEPVKKQSPGEPHALTPENIGAALFEINKAAKRRRDAAAAAYARRHHGVAAEQRVQKERLYSLKGEVLSKAEKDGIARFVGYHVKRDQSTHQVRRECDDGIALSALPEDECGEEFEFEQRDDHGHGLGRRQRWATVTEEHETAMACFELGGFRFHTILDGLPTDAKTKITDLGLWMSTATPRTRHMTLKDAEATLAAYLRAERANTNA